MIRVALPALLVLAFGAASCATTNGGTPAESPAPTTSPRLSPPLSQPPLDLTSAKAAPCSLVTDQIRQQFGLIGQGEPDPAGVTGPDCSFTENPIADPVVVVGVNTQSQGLEGLYERRENFVDFRPITVNGFPGLSLQQDAGGCGVLVAVTDEDLTSVDVRAGSAPTTAASVCDLATRLSSAVIANLS